MDKASAPPLVNRELSWLSFNERVLQEAEDATVPLFERLTFLAIYSSNLDEFFRVRVAYLRSLLRLKKKTVKKLPFSPVKLLRQIHRTVTTQQERFGAVLREQLLPALRHEGLFLIDERQLDAVRGEALRAYFWEEIEPLLQPALLGSLEEEPPFLKNKGLYLITELWERSEEIDMAVLHPQYGLVEIPSPPLDRFVIVPGGEAERREILFLDDIIRYFLPALYPIYDVGASYAVKISRDADLYLEDEFSVNLVEAIRKSLGKRETGLPTRFLYDMRMPYSTLAFLKERLSLEDEDLVVGGRYHNLNDFYSFPRCGRTHLSYEALPPLPHPLLAGAPSVREVIASKDQLLHFPYQSFGTVVRFFEEAAEDPAVTEIWITLYRVAEDSGIVRALMRAATRGKEVTAFVEAKARFDEASNLTWAECMEEAGVRVLYSMPGLKVHTKLALVVRREASGPRGYAYLGTGNFNEKTARVYADHALLTADERLTTEVRRVFAYLEGTVEAPTFEHLLVAPFYLRKACDELIAQEMVHALAGKEARILLKLNALEDAEIIERLYEAGQAGVDVRLIVRGICCLVPGVKGVSEAIKGTSILDRFLEHARIYAFHNDGDERLYLASADWMKRNLSRRVEVAFPIYDPDLRQELHAILELQTADTTKARRLDAAQQNQQVQPVGGARRVRAQRDTYMMLHEKAKAAVDVTGS